MTSTSYDPEGRATAIVQPDGSVVANEYYLNGLLKKTSGSRTYPVEYTYDAQGRLKTMKTWQSHSSGAGTATTTWNYDSARGWLSNKRYANNSLGPDYTYTPGGRLKTRAWARIAGASRLLTTYKYGFDDTPTNNQHPDLVEVSYSDNLTPITTTTYDRMGRPTTMTAGTTTMTRSYTAAGAVDTESYTAGTMNGLKTVYTYDGSLRRATVTAQNGASVLGHARTYAYDTASRLSSVSDGTYSGSYGYLANSPLWSTLTFKQGSTTVRATTTREFDRLNRLLVTTTTPGSGAGWSSRYAYNAANQRIRRADYDGSYWVYEYDALGQVISGKRFWADGSPVAGQQFEYAYDDIGNRTSSKEGGDGSGLNLRSVGYTRNDLNQYTQRTGGSLAEVLGVATGTASVTVNSVAATRKGEYFRREIPVSNASGPVVTLATVQATSGGSSTTTTGSILSPPATQTLTYDADGNLLSDGLWEYTWDGENRIGSIQSPTTLAAANRRKVSWEYDPAGRRIRQTTAGWNGTTWTNATDLKIVYDGWATLVDLNATNNAAIQSYVWGLDLSGTPSGAGGVGGLLWVRPNGGAAHFAVHDGNGNVIGLVDGSNGTESARYEYDTFGNTLRLTGTGSIAKDNPFRFSTKRFEAETGLILYEYRIYSSVLGRWPNRDPIEEKGGANLYGFGRNNAVNEVDFLGLESSEDDYTLELELGTYFFTYGNLAGKLLAHFYYGRGHLYRLTVDEMADVGAVVRPGDSRLSVSKGQGFSQYLQSAQATPGLAIEIRDMFVPLRATQGATLGHFSGAFDGKLIACGDDWVFSGTIRYRGNYDFNHIPGGDKVRNLISLLARLTIHGTAFPIESQLAPATENNSDHELQWRGTGIRHPDRSYEK